uniref:RNA-directed RNA polymerase n=1 Tax=Grapevine-associated noda-like virus 1 TaxID=2814396 RepID=A0A8F5RC07_9VIRU|nr:MAG: RNA-dependent RNA polymerase [Grapevine-associated noda-like virus 1]
MLGGYAGIDPYTPTVSNKYLRILQRLLIDKTRRDLRLCWFVASSFMNHKPKRISDNGHPVSGAIRDEARRLIDMAVSAQGWSRLEISPGGKSEDNSFADHQHFAVGDLHMGIKHDSDYNKGDVIVGIDIDYYIQNFNHYLALGKPMIFHTFNPTKVSGTDGDAHYRIKDNRVIYEVGGGGRWEHEVWDWCSSGEFIEASSTEGWGHWLLSWIGLREYYYHKIYTARPWIDCPGRVLVWTTPEYSHWAFSFIKRDINCRKLSRVNYRSKFRSGWNEIVSPTDDGLVINIGREGEDASVTLLKAHYDVLMGLKSTQSVTTRMIGLKYTKPEELALVGQYYSGDPNYVPAATRLSRSSVFVHWPYSTEVDIPETSSRSYAASLVTTPNLMPMTKRWETLSTSLERRVDFVRNTKMPNKQIVGFAAEFVKLVVPTPGEGVPYSYERAMAELDKPSQQLAIKQVWETLDAPARQLIESFVKNEPTNKEGRIISSFADARFLLGFSRFTLSCRDRLLHSETNEHWFCPGLTPVEIANKVREYCTQTPVVLEGDYSNFDGTVSAFLQRHVMNAVYLRYFHQTYSQEVRDYTEMLISCPARAKKFGFKYDAGVGVKSGSPTTCDLNSVLNAFLMYCAVRRTDPSLEPDMAFRMVGLAFGDDSLFDRQYKSQWQRVVDMVGMTIKIEECKPTTGVTFLARVFPNPVDTKTSFQDPVRTWRKLHITTRDPLVPLADAALDRIEGYLVTDALTPVTADYCKMVKRCYKSQANNLERRERRADHAKEKPYWLTTGGSWPQDPHDEELMLACMANRASVDVAELRGLRHCLSTTTDPWSVVPLDIPAEQTGVAPDGQPNDAEVDTRLIQQQRDVNHSRANQGAPFPRNQGAGRGRGRYNSGRGQAQSTTNRAARPGELSAVSRSFGFQAPQGHNGTPDQANGHGVVQRASRTFRPRGRGGWRGRARGSHPSISSS